MKVSMREQRGIALLLFLLIAFVLGSTLFVAGMSTSRQRLTRDQITQGALQQARDALIGDAANYKGSAYLPGRLRCPEQLSVSSPIEGQAQSSCGTTATRTGRFPWWSLKLDKLVDGYGEPLWFAVSPGFSTAPINSATPGQITVDGNANAAVALIIAPGPPLPGQNRSPPNAANPPQPGDYLELGNALGGPFATTGQAAGFNDKVLVVTQADLFRTVNQRVLAEIRGLDDQDPNLPAFGLRAYYNSHGGQFPPNGTPMSSLSYDGITSAWLSANNWFTQINYNQTSTTSAKISIGSSSMSIIPCTVLPCP